jgi:hypothetical protein
MRKTLFSGQFAPALGGQFGPARGGQFTPASGGQFDRFLHLTIICSICSFQLKIMNGIIKIL